MMEIWSAAIPRLRDRFQSADMSAHSKTFDQCAESRKTLA
jgi:hypothetical protein